MAMSMAICGRLQETLGMRVCRRTLHQFKSITKSTAMYAASESVSHRSTLAYCSYGRRISKPTIRPAIATSSSAWGSGTSRRTEAAIEPRSAPMLNPFATATSVTAPKSTHRGKPQLDERGEPMPRHQAQAGGGLLDRGGERERDPGRPQQSEAEGRSRLRVGADPGWVVVGGTGHQPRPQPPEVPEPPERVPMLVVSGTGCHGSHGTSRRGRPGTKQRAGPAA